ncbi:MAG: hypothetical protein M3R17_11695, partial [Bacteroidota bacterium]|nr:hypothetical protein [Bacteroidota bacterium]
MSKLYAEKIKRDADFGPTMPGTFRLRFNKDEPFIKPHFKLLLRKAVEDISDIPDDKAVEGTFIADDVKNEALDIVGTFDQSISDQPTTEDHIVERMDYEVVEMDTDDDGKLELVDRPEIIPDKDPVEAPLPPGVKSKRWGIGLYYENEVDALFIVADTYVDAVHYTRDQKFAGFWYFIDAQTGWMSVIQQKDSVAKYNQMYYSFTIELIDEVNKVANDQVLYDAVLKEGALGDKFIMLVKEAQDVVFPNKQYLYYGMYTPQTQKKVREEIKRQQEAEDFFMSSENFDAHYGLTPFYTTERISQDQINVINNLTDTKGLFGAANDYEKYSGKDRERDMNVILKHKNLEPTWTFKQWEEFKNRGEVDGRYLAPGYIVSRQTMNTNIKPAQHPYYEARATLNTDWAGDEQYVTNPMKLLKVVIELESTKYYGGLAGGKIDNSTEFFMAYNTYVRDRDQIMKPFYTQYLRTRTFEMIEEGKQKLAVEMGRYGIVEGDYVGEGPEIQALMTDMQLPRAYYSRAQDLRDKVPPIVGEYDDNPHANNSDYQESIVQEDLGFAAFNKLRDKYPILLSAEFGKQLERKSIADPISYGQSGNTFAKRFITAATDDKAGRTATIQTLF